MQQFKQKKKKDDQCSETGLTTCKEQSAAFTRALPTHDRQPKRHCGTDGKGNGSRPNDADFAYEDHRFGALLCHRCQSTVAVDLGISTCFVCR